MHLPHPPPPTVPSVPLLRSKAVCKVSHIWSPNFAYVVAPVQLRSVRTSSKQTARSVLDVGRERRAPTSYRTSARRVRAASTWQRKTAGTERLAPLRPGLAAAAAALSTRCCSINHCFFWRRTRCSETSEGDELSDHWVAECPPALHHRVVIELFLSGIDKQPGKETVNDTETDRHTHTHTERERGGGDDCYTATYVPRQSYRTASNTWHYL